MAFKLARPAAFFDSLRSGLLGPDLSQSEVEGCNALLEAFGAASWPLSWAAYGFATAYHETSHSMQPVKEIGGPRYFFRMYDKDGNRPSVAKRLGNSQAGDGARYFGRGYVQLTGRSNYRKAGEELRLPLEADPDLALQPEIAARVMVRGMNEGWFTTQRCSTHLPLTSGGDKACFCAARKIINGQDCAPLIASYALKFQEALAVGGWR
jgi:putative chitinase